MTVLEDAGIASLADAGLMALEAASVDCELVTLAVGRS